MSQKKFLRTIFTDKGRSAGLLLLRVAAGIMLMTHGAAKIMNYDQLSTSFADPIGLGPQVSLILIILAEIGASALIILGAFTRLAAASLVFSMTIAAFFSSPEFNFTQSETAILYLLIFLTLFITGAGRYSADRLINIRLRKID